MTAKRNLRLRRHDVRLIGQAVRFIQVNPAEKLDAGTIAAAIGISTYKLKAGFPVVTGKAFAHFVRETRLQKAQVLLQESNILVAEVARQCGYRNEASFYRAFKQWTGKTPDRYREAGSGE